MEPVPLVLNLRTGQMLTSAERRLHLENQAHNRRMFRAMRFILRILGPLIWRMKMVDRQNAARWAMDDFSFFPNGEHSATVPVCKVKVGCFECHPGCWSLCEARFQLKVTKCRRWALVRLHFKALAPRPWAQLDRFRNTGGIVIDVPSDRQITLNR